MVSVRVIAGWELLMVFWREGVEGHTTAAKYWCSCSAMGSRQSGWMIRKNREILERPTLMVPTEAGEVMLQLGENVLECHDGLLLGRMRRAKVDGLCGGLWKESGQSSFELGGASSWSRHCTMVVYDGCLVVGDGEGGLYNPHGVSGTRL